MSTTAPTARPPRTSTVRVAPADAFERLIWDRPHCCNACFSRLQWDGRLAEDAAGAHGHDAHDPAGLDYGETTVRDDETGQVIGTAPRGTHRNHPLYSEATVCNECGSVNGTAPDDKLSTTAALERLGPLADRLAECGIEVDRRAMAVLVRKAKAADRKDKPMFKKAVELGMSHA